MNKLGILKLMQSRIEVGCVARNVNICCGVSRATVLKDYKNI